MGRGGKNTQTRPGGGGGGAGPGAQEAHLAVAAESSTEALADAVRLMMVQHLFMSVVEGLDAMMGMAFRDFDCRRGGERIPSYDTSGLSVHPSFRTFAHPTEMPWERAVNLLVYHLVDAVVADSDRRRLLHTFTDHLADDEKENFALLNQGTYWVLGCITEIYDTHPLPREDPSQCFASRVATRLESDYEDLYNASPGSAKAAISIAALKSLCAERGFADVLQWVAIAYTLRVATSDLAGSADMARAWVQRLGGALAAGALR